MQTQACGYLFLLFFKPRQSLVEINSLWPEGLSRMKWEKYHTVWAIMIFGWITNYMVRSSLSPLLIPILQEFKLTYAQAGILATAFFYAYTMMQLPAGRLGARLGRKVVLVLCTSWWGFM